MVQNLFFHKTWHHNKNMRFPENLKCTKKQNIPYRVPLKRYIGWISLFLVIVHYYTGVRFTTRCRALTAGLSLTLNLTTNSTIPVSQPLSCVSLSCANLSLSLTLQISQWSSSIETTSSDYRFSGVNRELQVLNVSGFIKGNIPRISSYTWLFAKNTGWFVVLRSNP